ncbi:MAG: hypothetical protein PF484_14875 [Bacteroidales bacterium]|jgi:hypothetical protein|nr:hypothetical protein [Bacteroidales bacterium]
MKKYLFILSFLSLVLFIDYIIIIVAATVFSLSGIEIHFFQETYKIIGLTLVGISLLSAGIYLRIILPRLPSIY